MAPEIVMRRALPKRLDRSQAAIPAHKRQHISLPSIEKKVGCDGMNVGMYLTDMYMRDAMQINVEIALYTHT